MHMVTMINGLGIPMLVANPMMTLLMLVLVRMMRTMLLLFQLCFGGWLQPCLVDLNIHCVCRAASVAFPDMLLVKRHPVQWLSRQVLRAHQSSAGMTNKAGNTTKCLRPYVTDTSRQVPVGCMIQTRASGDTTAVLRSLMHVQSSCSGAAPGPQRASVHNVANVLLSYPRSVDMYHCMSASLGCSIVLQK